MSVSEADHGAAGVAAPPFPVFPVIASGVARGMDLRRPVVVRLGL